MEKTVADTKKQILEADMTETKFGQDEEKMVYYFMLSSSERNISRLWVLPRSRRLSFR